LILNMSFKSSMIGLETIPNKALVDPFHISSSLKDSGLTIEYLF
jgi:hypothetical protein